MKVPCIPSIDSILKGPFSLQEPIKIRYTNVDLQREVKATRIQKDLCKKKSPYLWGHVMWKVKR